MCIIVRDRVVLASDMTMPHLTGIELANELFKLEPNLAILLCTGFSKNADGERANRVGIQGFLMKPVILRKLAEMVRKVPDEKMMQKRAPKYMGLQP